MEVNPRVLDEQVEYFRQRADSVARVFPSLQDLLAQAKQKKPSGSLSWLRKSADARIKTNFFSISREPTQKYILRRDSP